MYIYIVTYIYIICRWWIFVDFPAMVDEPEKNDGKQIAISHRIVCVSTHHASTLSATLGWQALDGKDGLISQVSPYVSWFIIPINYRYITNQNHIVNYGSYLHQLR